MPHRRGRVAVLEDDLLGAGQVFGPAPALGIVEDNYKIGPGQPHPAASRWFPREVSRSLREMAAKSWVNGAPNRDAPEHRAGNARHHLDDQAVPILIGSITANGNGPLPAHFQNQAGHGIDPPDPRWKPRRRRCPDKARSRAADTRSTSFFMAVLTNLFARDQWSDQVDISGCIRLRRRRFPAPGRPAGSGVPARRVRCRRCTAVRGYRQGDVGRLLLGNDQLSPVGRQQGCGFSHTLLTPICFFHHGRTG